MASASPEVAQIKKGQKVLCLIYPKIESMMTGVWRVERAHGLTMLTYTDNTREGAMIPDARWNEISGNLFSIVREVQDARTGRF